MTEHDTPAEVTAGRHLQQGHTSRASVRWPLWSWILLGSANLIDPFWLGWVWARDSRVAARP